MYLFVVSLPFVGLLLPFLTIGSLFEKTRRLRVALFGLALYMLKIPTVEIVNSGRRPRFPPLLNTPLQCFPSKRGQS